MACVTAGLLVMKVLTITKVRLSDLDAENLSSLVHLQELDLDGNNLTEFNAMAFEVREPRDCLGGAGLREPWATEGTERSQGDWV